MAQKQDSARRRIEDFTIVDADAHVVEKVEDFAPYIENDVIRRKVQHESDPKSHIYSGVLTNSSNPAQTIEQDIDSDNYQYKPARESETKVEDMEAFGIDYSILQPTLNNNLDSVNNPQVAMALANAYNSWLIDEFADKHEGIKLSVTVAPQQPDKSAEEIDDRADEKDVVAVHMTSSLSTPAGDTWYDPIYQAAEDNGLPIVHHGSVFSFAHCFPLLFQKTQNAVEAGTLAHPFYTATNFVTALARGMPVRYPDLKIVFQESGVAWLPFWMWRLDDHYLTKGDELPHLNELPSTYVGKNIFTTTQPVGVTAEHPEHLGWAVEMCGVDAVMYSADLPHPAFDPPEELYNRIQGNFEEDELARIMGETAVDIFNLS